MLARKTLLVVLNNLVGGALGAVALLFTSRYLAPSAVGSVAFATSVAGLGFFLATLGFDSAHIKRVAEGRPLGDCIATYRTIRWGLGLAATILLAAVVIAWDRFQGFSDATTLPVLLIAILGLLITSVRAIGQDTFVGLAQVARVQAIFLVDNLVRQPAAIVAALLAGAVAFAPIRAALFGQETSFTVQQSALALMAAFLLGNVAASLVSAALLRRSRFQPGRFDVGLMRDYWRFALPVSIAAPVALLSNEIDSIAIGYFWSNTEVGYYWQAKRVVTLVTILPSAMAAVFFPLVSRMMAQKDDLGVKGLVHDSLRGISLLLTPALMFLLLYAKAGIHVALSDAYLPAANVLRLLALQAYLVGPWLVFTAILQADERPWKVLAVSQVALVGNILLNLVLVPTSLLGVPLFGMKGEGSALATVVSQAAALAWLVAVVPSTARRSIPWAAIVRHVLAAAITASALWAVRAWLPMGPTAHLWSLAVAGIGGLALYVGLLAVIGEVRGADVRSVRDLFSASQMRNYVQEEL